MVVLVEVKTRVTAEAGKGRAGEETGGGWLMIMTLELRASSLVL